MQEHLKRLANKLQTNVYPYHVTHYDSSIYQFQMKKGDKIIQNRWNLKRCSYAKDKQMKESTIWIDYILQVKTLTLEIPYTQTGKLEHEELKYKYVLKNEKSGILKLLLQLQFV